MTKEQFIMELEQCLQGEVSAYELSDSLTYYRQYFEDEIRNGKSEEQVVEELGSPRLIARSIIDAHGIEESASGNSDYGDNSYGSGYAQNDSSYRSYGDAYSNSSSFFWSKPALVSSSWQNTLMTFCPWIISSI